MSLLKVSLPFVGIVLVTALVWQGRVVSKANGVAKAAELGYDYIEPMVHWGRELLSEAGYFHSVSMDDDPLEIRDILDRHNVRASGLSSHCPLMASGNTVRGMSVRTIVAMPCAYSSRSRPRFSVAICTLRSNVARSSARSSAVRSVSALSLHHAKALPPLTPMTA